MMYCCNSYDKNINLYGHDLKLDRMVHISIYRLNCIEVEVKGNRYISRLL